MKAKDYLWISLGMIFNPGQTLFVIKRRRDKLSYLFLLFMIILFSVTYLAKIQLTHFPVSTVNIRTYNMVNQLSIPLIPIIAWIIAGYAVTTIKEGSAKFLEFAVTVVTCTVPYIILSIPLALMSYMFEVKESALYATLNSVLVIWVVVLLFYSFMQINDYGFVEALKVSFIGLLALFAMLFIAFILYSMTAQLLQFISQVALEIQLINIGG